MATLTQLEYLVAVDRRKHFGKASEDCHVSQPSLSLQIQKLEEELGLIIFDRSKKPILTTDAGKKIIAQARQVLKEQKRLVALAQDVGREPQGAFHLAIIPTLSPYLTPLFIKEFSEEFPKVQLKISEYRTEEIIHLLIEDEIDAGILVTPLGDERLIERHLFWEPFYVYLSQSHALRKKKEIAEKDLKATDLWLLEEGHCFRDQALRICAHKARDSVLNNVQFASGSLETLKYLVKQSTGYTLLPELALCWLSEDEIKNFVRVFKKPVPTREVSLVHARSFLKESIIQALENTIIKQLPRQIRSLKRADVEVIKVYG